jgi:hypothetical protein
VSDVKLLLRPISNELVALRVPAPARVMPRIPAHVMVEAAPTETVATVAFGVIVVKPDWTLDVPVIVNAPVIVVVAPGSIKVVPSATVIDAKVPAFWILNADLELLAAIVSGP